MYARELSARDWARFDDKWVVRDNGCHLWLGETDRRGRGRFSVYATDGSRAGSRSAKHLAWERSHGRRLPRAHVLRATCEDPNCVNPEHHESGTRRAVQMAVARARGFDGQRCPNGHVGEYTPLKTGPQKGNRYCKACRRESARERYWRKKKGDRGGSEPAPAS